MDPARPEQIKSSYSRRGPGKHAANDGRWQAIGQFLEKVLPKYVTLRTDC